MLPVSGALQLVAMDATGKMPSSSAMGAYSRLVSPEERRKPEKESCFVTCYLLAQTYWSGDRCLIDNLTPTGIRVIQSKINKEYVNKYFYQFEMFPPKTYTKFIMSNDEIKRNDNQEQTAPDIGKQ